MTINQIVKMLSNMLSEMYSYYSAHTRPSDKWTSILLKSLEELEKYKWISVTDCLPQNEETVLIRAECHLCDGRTRNVISIGCHTDGKHNTEQSKITWDDYDCPWEYDEKADAYIIPEGWWEEPRYSETGMAIDDFVTHWMKLPESPDNNDN